MFSLEIACAPGEQDLLIAELWEQQPAGIVEIDGSRLRVFFENDAARESLAARFKALAWRQEEPCDWVAMSRRNWDPIVVGERFFLVPEWRDDPTPPGRFRVVVNPGLAFGTGLHETTQLCLESLETRVRAGSSVLDVGTGSGILSRAAVLLGAAPVWACDIDPEAVQVAKSHPWVSAFIGSADAVRARSADLVLANISPEAISLLAADLLRCLRPNGTALVSGFETQDIPAMESAVAREGGCIREVRQKGTWALLAVAAGSAFNK